jgi:YlmC/YmxH family sporulation protein
MKDVLNKEEFMLKENGMDFSHKEVININDGKRLGYVQDVCANLGDGRITSIIVPGNKKLLNIFSKGEDIVIEWEKIKCIGDDVILVDI